MERARRDSFILRHILTLCALVAAASISFAVLAAPALSDVLTLVWLIVPVGAILLSPMAGKLIPAEAFSSSGFIAAGLTAAIGGGALHQTALAWLILAPIESMFSMNGILVAVTGTLAALTALLLGATWAVDADPTFFLVPATAFATMVGIGFVSFRNSRRAAERPQTGDSGTSTEPLSGLVVRHDRLGAAKSVSPNCEALFGLAPGELMGRGFFEHVHVADRPAFLKAISDAGLGSATIKTTLRWRGSARVDRGDYAEPVFHWLDMHARRSEEPSRGGAETQPDDGVIAIFHDITEKKLHETTLQSLRTGAEEGNLAKDFFLAHVGHELRTPLNAIVGFSELLGNPQLAPVEPEKLREYAGIIHQSGQHLLALVNSILDMSKIQSGVFAVELERFVVAPLIDLCCDMVRLQAKDSGVELLRAYPESLVEITGDKRACKQILINLLSNAVKFTPPGGSVRISAAVEAESLVVQVVDTGIGISARDLAHLGDPFFQAKALPDGHDMGTGLGLSIVRGLVGLQGGTITVASESGKGTCVNVRLPIDCSGLTGKMTSAEIKTIARLPLQDDKHDLCKQMTVKKIA